jgi:hypothetical protein
LPSGAAHCHTKVSRRINVDRGIAHAGRNEQCELGHLFEQASGEGRALPHGHNDLEAPQALRNLLRVCQMVAKHLYLHVRR